MRQALEFFQGRQDLALIGLLMVTIIVMIVPLPTWIIDILITCNISLTLLVLLVAVYLKRPHDFTSFPAIILIATTFRLAITISTTRLILSQADAGAIIDTFGNFVTQGSVIVGLVIFLIVTTVQFVVITKGSERVAEVAARFTLDGLPGRQMSIDSELRAGDITPEEAQAKRAQLEKENQFFGAMDGAMKFVKGDAIAGLIVIAINLIGGISIGMIGENMSAGAAVNVYSRLTVGDGLVSQIPALIVALCAGTIITRVNAGQDSDLGTDIFRQLASHSKSMFLGAGLVCIMAMIPGFPASIFLTVAAILALAGYFMSKREKAEGTLPDGTRADAQRILQDGLDGQTAAQSQKGDIVSIGLGERLFSTLNRRAFLQAREAELQRISGRSGLDMPAFGLFLDDNLGPNQMRVVLDAVPCFSGDIPDDVLIACCEGDLIAINDLPVLQLDKAWPVQPGFWIDQSAADLLTRADVEVLDPAELVARTTGHYISANAARILGHNQVQQIVRELGKEHDNLASQIGQSISAVQLLNILRGLVAEHVPLRPRRILFEALLESTVTGGSTQHFIDNARKALSRQICANIADENQVLSGYVLEPSMELALRGCLASDGDDIRIVPNADISTHLLSDSKMALAEVEPGVTPPVILAASELRAPIYTYLRQNNVEIQVMAFPEISPEFRFHPIGTIGGQLPEPDHLQEAAA
ncbi:MAG: flagellar biosynthesis protein FlhA [Pseudomonadota bacterium]